MRCRTCGASSMSKVPPGSMQRCGTAVFTLQPAKSDTINVARFTVLWRAYRRALVLRLHLCYFTARAAEARRDWLTGCGLLEEKQFPSIEKHWESVPADMNNKTMKRTLRTHSILGTPAADPVTGSFFWVCAMSFISALASNLESSTIKET